MIQDNEAEMTQENKEKIKNQSYSTLLEMRQLHTKYLVIQVAKPLTSFVDIQCSCYHFMKKKKCKHVFKYLRINNRLNCIFVSLLSRRPKEGVQKRL
ncbi:hypothetical protein ENBRE01_2381 [Enteropsectra breve]|nr:hypothetical protein ENBRE01_2381 [Enteropsectra breve]